MTDEQKKLEKLLLDHLEERVKFAVTENNDVADTALVLIKLWEHELQNAQEDNSMKNIELRSLSVDIQSGELKVNGEKISNADELTLEFKKGDWFCHVRCHKTYSAGGSAAPEDAAIPIPSCEF